MRSRNAHWALLAPFATLFALFFVAPILYAMYQSTRKVDYFGAGGLGGRREVFAGLENYRTALTDGAFLDSLQRVLLFGVVQVPLMIALATTLALLLESGAARGARFFRAAYFLPYGVPGVIASILWGFLYVPGISPIVSVLGEVGLDVNFLGSGAVLWSIVNIVTWEFAGYNMLVIVAQLQSIDGSLYESAHMDGATGWQMARYIKLPLVRPALVLTTVFSIIGTLQLFSEPLILKTISTGITSDFTPNMSAYSEAFVNNNYHLAAAQSVIVAVIALVLSFGFLRIVKRRADR